MNSKIFGDLSVYKKKETTTNLLENCSSVYHNISEHESINFFANLDKVSVAEGYKELSYHLGRVNPNNIVHYVDKLTKYPIDVYAYTMLPFLTDQNIIKFKNYAYSSGIDTATKSILSTIIENESSVRLSKEYTKISLFNSVRKNTYSNAFKNCVIKELYASNFNMFSSNECINIDDMCFIIDNFIDDEIRSSRDFIYELIMAFTLSTITYARHIMKRSDYNKCDYEKLFNTLYYKVVVCADNNCIRVAMNASKIAIKKINAIIPQIKENTEAVNFLNSIIVLLDSINAFNKSSVMENVAISHVEYMEIEDYRDQIREIEDEFADIFIDFILDNREVDVELSQMDDMLRLSYVYESKVADTAVKGAVKAKKGVSKGTKAIRTVGRDVTKVAKATRDIPEPFTNLVKNTLTKLKQMDNASRRQAILSGGFKQRLMRTIRMGIKLAMAKGIWSALGPVYGSLGILVQFYLDGKLNYREKQKIIEELEMELAIVEEKIEDARGDNDKKAKYELMRLKNNLAKEIRRLKRSL